MKKIPGIITITCILFSLAMLNGCKEKIDPVIEELNFNRAFSPVGLEAEISNVTTVTLTWSAVKNTDHYVLEIYEGTDFAASALVYTTDVDADKTTFTYVLPAGDTQFSARLMAVSSLTGVDESKWSSVAFKSAPENLFTGYESMMTGLGSCIVRWQPGVVATALLFVDGANETSFALTESEKAAGEKILTGVTNASYEVYLMNGTFSRGVVSLLIEGDALLPAGGDLAAAIAATPAGGVLLLTNGADYPLAVTDTIRSSIKIRGVLPDDLPTIYLATGTSNHIFDVDPAMTFSDYVIFENVDISCYYDDAGLVRHRGVFDVESTPVSLDKLIFNNCIIRNSGRSAVRLRGNAAGQVINNVEFNNCIMYDFAWDSHYGVLNPSASTASMVNIKFTNSTIYNIRGGIINYGTGIGCASVLIDNCTFNQTEMDAASGRWFIDFSTGSSTGAITISDCIFGQTSALGNGIRTSTMTLAVTGSYRTTDFVDVNGLLLSSLTAYSGASAALWVDPVTTFDFHFLDANFAGKNSAGDPRWKP